MVNQVSARYSSPQLSEGAQGRSCSKSSKPAVGSCCRSSRCSVVAVAIVLERLWTLQEKRVLPVSVANQVWELAQHNQIDAKQMQTAAPELAVRAGACGRPRVSARAARRAQGGRRGRGAPRGSRSRALPESARHDRRDLAAARVARHGVGHDPLVHRHHGRRGVGNPAVLAGGISEALITTAAGLTVAIPSLIAYRYLRGRVDGLVVRIEKESMRFIEALLHQQRTGCIWSSR